MSKKSLLIVESPTKVKTIQQYLGDDYDVLSCVGHIKDLPKNDLGIDIENEFKIELTVLPDKKEFINKLRSKSKKALRVLIATDPDREGEAIAAHLATEVPEEKLERVQFTEITKPGIIEGIKNFRKVDKFLVAAQATRRIIDRLVGYKVSPVLWATLQSNMNFVTTSLSAGRVQSAAVKMIVDKDRLRANFNKTSYFDLKATLLKIEGSQDFKSSLIRLNKVKIASSNDFDSITGDLKNQNATILSESQADELVKELNGGKWVVSEIKESPRKSNPKPPFTTSTLQQEASRKLRYSARQTMTFAQQLYENGFITYMRTDSTHLSEEALAGSRNFIQKEFGDDYLPEKPNQYATKVKNAQEAHEAIRPAHRVFRPIEEVKHALSENHSKLYDLIWKRTIASQMPPAKLKQTSITIKNQEAEFRANGQIVLFPGYMKVYVESQDNKDKELENKERILPNLKEGELLDCQSIDTESHETKPPARFTEASLVKALEENGIGRPSTFASILATIVRRGYVDRKGSKLSPTYLGLAVTQLLENHFSNLVDKEFTAKMENGLDDISRGELESIPFMTNFYKGGGRFTGLEKMLEEKVDIPNACKIPIPDDISENTEGRIGKFGPYLRRGEDIRSIPENVYVGDLTVETIEQIFEEITIENEPLGNDPETNEPIWIKKGPYGHYVQIGETKTRKGIPKNYPLADVNLAYALKLLSLPRNLGAHPDDGEAITADYGRYGPYIKCGKKNAPLRGQETPLDVTLDIAIELLEGRKRQANDIKSLGKHPKSGKDLTVKTGRYGPYVSDGKVNASLKGNIDPELITLDEAIGLIDQRIANPPKKRRKAKKK